MEKNSSVEQTLGTITNKLVSKGYLKENSGILVTLVKKGKKQDYEKLISVINNELEDDVLNCGVSGVKVEFQTVNSKMGKTGKEILKDRMKEQYHLNNDKVDNMNIGDMFDYIESKEPQKRILEKVNKREDKKKTSNDSQVEMSTQNDADNTKKQNSKSTLQNQT